MSRSVKSSNDDTELKIGRTHIQLSTTQSIMNSPLRRSSRIKQAKYSPVSSESDTSIVSNSQSIKNTRKRTVTMDAETKGRVRKLSVSSDISETISTDILEIPGRRTTRSSLAATTLIGTPTKITRAVSKRLIRAGSETKSPLPSVRITRRTRASSVDPESLSNQNKSQPCTPVKISKRTSILPLESPVKEEVEEKDLVPYVRLNVTIAEIDEVISSGSSPNNSLGSQQNKEVNRNQNKNKVKEDNNYDKIASSLSKIDETCPLSKEKNEIVDKKESFIEGQFSFEENIPVDDTTIEVSIHDSFSNSASFSNSKRENKSETIKKDLSTKSPTKELGIKIEHSLNTLVEEQKRYPSNKKNQTLNIVTNESEEKSMQPSINITPLDIKSLTSIIVNKSLNEKETISMKDEPNSDKHYSRELTETTIKHNTLSKESTDNIEEIIDISTNFSSPDVTSKKKNFGDSLLNDANKRQSLVHDADDKLATMNDTNELILLQHDNVELIDKTIDKDKMPIENISESNENAIEVTGKSYEIDKTECKQSDANKTEFNEKNRTSYSPMKTTIEQKSNCEESSILITDDKKIKLVLEEQNLCRNGNEISNVIQSNFDHSINSLIDKKNPSLLNVSCNNQFTVMDKWSTVIQDDTVNNTDFTEQKNVSKYIVESIPEVSNFTLQTNNSVCNTDVDNIIIQNVQSSCKIETSKNSISSGEIDLKDISLEDTLKLNAQQKSTDDTFNNLETKIENLQLEKSHKDKKSMESMDNDFDVNMDISLFKDIPVDKCKKKIYKKKNDIETNLEHSNPQSIEEIKNESETECDLVLVDKQAWLAAKNMKAVKQSESFEYDSDDTVLLKSRLDAALASYDVKQLDSIHKELLTDFDSEEDEVVKPVKVWKTIIKRRSESRTDKDSLTGLTEDDLITADKSLNKSTAVLNRNSNRSASELNTSEQIAKIGKQLSVTHDELGEEIEKYIDELNRNLQINEKNTSLRKSTEGRKSLNKSSKDITLKQENNIMQNISLNKSQIDNSEEELNTNASIGKKLQKKKHFLNKSHDKDINNDTTEFKETKNLSSKDNQRNKSTPLSSLINENSKLANTKTSIHSNDDKSNDSEIVIPAMDFRSKGYSTVAQVESIPDNPTKITLIYLNNKSNDNEMIIPADFESNSCSTIAQVGSNSDDSDTIPHFLFERVSSDDSTNDSTDSDIKTEYNLDGMKQMFSDDNVLADECRASESEFSDSDDNGSDLADFIVNDDELEDEEEEAKKQDNNEEKEEKYDEEDKQSMGKDECTEEMVDNENENKKNTNESNGTANKEEVGNEDKQLNVNIEQADIEIKTRDNEDIQEKNNIVNEKGKKSVKVKIDAISNIYNKSPKIYENKKDKFIEYTSPCTSQTEAKRKVKIKKFDMKENKTILSDTSNLYPSKKKKSYMKENEKITLGDKSNSISTKRRKKSDPCSSKDIAEQNSIEQLNESELTFTRKLHKPRIIMECSTPKLGTSKQEFEINATSETFRKISEFKDTKSNNTNKTMQNILLENNSKKHSVFEDIDLREFNRTNKKEKILNSSFPSDLSMIGKTSVRSTSSKMIELHKTMDVTHTETPTIRYLRKERLNESAPVSKLNTAIIPLRKKLLLAKEEKDIEQIEIKEKNDKEKVPDLVMLSDNAMEKHQRKHKKRKKQVEETLCENIIEDTIKLNTKKKRCVKLSQSPIVKDNTCEDMCYVNKKEKKKKKQSITEPDESVNEDYILERNSREKNMELVQHRKKYKEIIDTLKWDSFTDNYMVVKKKDRYQENAETKETLPQKLSKKKKKKEEKISLLQAVVSKSKSEKNLELNRPQIQNIISDTIKSKNTAFARARNEALEAIYAAEMHIKNNKELKKKEKCQHIKNKIVKQDKILTKKQKKVVKEINKSSSSSDNLKRLPNDIIENLTDIPRKKPKKVVKEINESSSSSGNLKRLPDDIIENLTDMPRKAKRQKLSRNREQIMSSPSRDSTRSKLTAKNDGFIALSTSGSITQFTTVNLRKAKQPSKRSAAAAISFRQRMLVRNNREPVSAYMMYLEKHAASNKKF